MTTGVTVDRKTGTGISARSPEKSPRGDDKKQEAQKEEEGAPRCKIQKMRQRQSAETPGSCSGDDGTDMMEWPADREFWSRRRCQNRKRKL